MSQLHKALECLRPKDFSDVPLETLNEWLAEIFAKAEVIANSVPPPPNGEPYESAHRTRTDKNGATRASELTISEVRRPPPAKEHEDLRKSWGKPLKLGSKETATGIAVYKMAGHDRHGAWFARTSVHEGLGFAKWKRAMMREFPESLAVQGGPGEGNVRGIGGDKRLEDITVDGLGKLEVYQLSAQFPGPTAPREFITLLLTSDSCLSDASKVVNTSPRHFMVVSIPVTHPDAPPRDGLVRGMYESIEMIREIPMTSSKSTTAPGVQDLSDVKGEKIDREEAPDDEDPETNPVEWIMVTRSDPGGGIPRFMVERSVPSSIVNDAGKFLDWACAKEDFPSREEDEMTAEESARRSLEDERAFSISDANGILAGVGTSIADGARPVAQRRPSEGTMDTESNNQGVLSTVVSTIEAYVPDPLNPLQRTDSRSSSITSSSVDSFASAEQFTTAPDGLPIDDSIPTPSTTSEQSLSLAPTNGSQSHMSRELQKIEQKRLQLKERLEQTREKQGKEAANASLKSTRELEKTTEKHKRERKKQEDKFAREVQKLEARRERETKKLLARQQKEADKSNLQSARRERDEWKQKAELAEQENKLLKEQIGELQKENTALVARIGKSDAGRELLKRVREELDGKDSSRRRAGSLASTGSGGSGRKSELSQTTLSKEESTAS